MKFKRLFISIFLLIPFNVLAYSSKVVVGGQNIGIEVKTKGVLVIGFYEVNNKLIAKDSGITKGDYIISVNNNDVNTIEDFTKEIYNDDDKIDLEIKYIHDNNEYNTKLKIEYEDNDYKTGLFVKDTVNGIGTLTMIDPEDNKFIALGHQIMDSSTNKILDINSGSIYSSYITGIKKSTNGSPGEKEAIADIDNKYGIITNNTYKGIYGNYETDYDKDNLVELADIDEIKLGKASILTVLNSNEIKEYGINIDKIDKKDGLKNILFSVTDKELIDKTGGIVQGMSGSPIMQNGKLIGAVTHVIVNDCTRGYGIYIKNMLEE